LVGSPERKTVELRLQQGPLRLLFTDKPLLPEDADPSVSESDSSLAEKILEAIWQGFRGAPPAHTPDKRP